jgi:glutathione peroxidase
VLDHRLNRIDGTPQNLADYRGQVLLLVNVASKCGLTPQYDALEALHDRYKERGFAVLGFPANDFAGQEPGSDAQIAEFCRSLRRRVPDVPKIR